MSKVSVGHNISVKLSPTSALYSAKLPPSGPTQNLEKIIIACAMTSWGSRSKMPAAWVRRTPAKRTESSKSAGTPSRRELDVSSWPTVANGFAKGDGCIAEPGKI